MENTKKINGEDKMAQEDSRAEFGIQRIYIKDLSFEAPHSPMIFLEQWKPEVGLDLNTQVNALDKQDHEVVLTVTVTVKKEEKTVFLAEVKQAGIFSIKNIPQEQLPHMLGSFCPNILYPYAREAISDLASRGGFPQLYLAPINFDALFDEHQKSQAKAGEKQ